MRQLQMLQAEHGGLCGRMPPRSRVQPVRRRGDEADISAAWPQHPLERPSGPAAYNNHWLRRSPRCSAAFAGNRPGPAPPGRGWIPRGRGLRWRLPECRSGTRPAGSRLHFLAWPRPVRETPGSRGPRQEDLPRVRATKWPLERSGSRARRTIGVDLTGGHRPGTSPKHGRRGPPGLAGPPPRLFKPFGCRLNSAAAPVAGARCSAATAGSVDRLQVEIVDFHRGPLLQEGDGHDQPRLAATDEHRALHACQRPTGGP